MGVYNNSEMKEVIGCVLKLPKKYRAWFHLVYYEGYKLHEIASFLAIDEQTVADGIEQCRQQMMQILEEECVRECENYAVRYKEELDAVRHDIL